MLMGGLESIINKFRHRAAINISLGILLLSQSACAINNSFASQVYEEPYPAFIASTPTNTVRMAIDLNYDIRKASDYDIGIMQRQSPTKTANYTVYFPLVSNSIPPTPVPTPTPAPTPTLAPSLCYSQSGYARSPAEKTSYILNLSSAVEYSQKRIGINHNFLVPAGGFNPAYSGTPASGWARFVFLSQEDNLNKAFETYDQYFYDLAMHKIKPVVVFNTQSYIGNYWASLEPMSEWDKYVKGYSEQLKKFLERYGYSVAAIQIGNEPNFSTSIIPPAQYSKMLQSAAGVIDEFNKSRGTNIQKVSAGLSPNEEAVEYLKNVRSALGRDLPVDAIGYHIYGLRLEGTSYRYAEWEWNHSSPGINSVLDQFRKDGFRQPFMITEAGIHEKNPERQKERAEWYSKLAEYLFKARNDVSALIFFAGSDANENGYGLVNSFCQPYNEIFDAYKQLVEKY